MNGKESGIFDVAKSLKTKGPAHAKGGKSLVKVKWFKKACLVTGKSCEKTTNAVVVYTATFFRTCKDEDASCQSDGEPCNLTNEVCCNRYVCSLGGECVVEPSLPLSLSTSLSESEVGRDLWYVCYEKVGVVVSF